MAEIYINVLNNFQDTPTFKSELDDYKKMKREREVMRVEWIPSCFAHGKLVEFGQPRYAIICILFSYFPGLDSLDMLNSSDVNSELFF